MVSSSRSSSSSRSGLDLLLSMLVWSCGSYLSGFAGLVIRIERYFGWGTLGRVLVQCSLSLERPWFLLRITEKCSGVRGVEPGWTRGEDSV